MQNYRQLEEWHAAVDLTVIIQRITSTFPQNAEAEIRRTLMQAALSIPAKMAKGYVKGSEIDLGAHIEYTLRACAETDTLLEISCLLDYLSREELELVRTRMLRLMEKLDNRQPLPWSPLEDGWHYEPEEMEEEEKEEKEGGE